jgi:hypothetical protein
MRTLFLDFGGPWTPTSQAVSAPRRGVAGRRCPPEAYGAGSWRSSGGGERFRKGSDYQRGFYEGYNKVARQKNVSTALGSSGAGWLTWIVSYSASSSSSSSRANTVPMLQVSF